MSKNLGQNSSIKDMIQSELNFSRKYCARVAAQHQNAKDEVLSLEIKMKELNERDTPSLNTVEPQL